jgi:hypothetical protein
MKNFILYAMILYSTTVMTSCVKELTLIQEDFNDDLVINGLIKAYEPISISVTRQLPISLTGNNQVDTSLTIILTQNDEISDTMLYSNSRYFSSHTAIPGNQYSITIQSPGKEDLYAETIIPEGIPDLKCEFTAGRIIDDYGEAVTECFISFKDDENQMDYYLVYLGNFFRKDHYSSSETFSVSNYWSYWQLKDPLLVNEGILDYNPSYFVFSDELIQGKNFTLNLNLKYGSSVKNCVVQRISVEYYHFMKSLIRHQYNQQYIHYSSFDPMELLIKGPPSEIYTNIVNGKGVFASYSENIEKFKNITAK